VGKKLNSFEEFKEKMCWTGTCSKWREKNIESHCLMEISDDCLAE
jgi:hypothetical protein